MPVYSFFLKRAGEAQSERKKESHGEARRTEDASEAVFWIMSQRIIRAADTLLKSIQPVYTAAKAAQTIRDIAASIPHQKARLYQRPGRNEKELYRPGRGV